MKTPSALLRPAHSGAGWIIRKYRTVFHETAAQSHALTVFKVNRWDN
jgi:hypothetical protein